MAFLLYPPTLYPGIQCLIRLVTGHLILCLSLLTSHLNQSFFFFSVDSPHSLPPPSTTSSSCLFFLPVVTKGFVYSSFLRPYNARRSHSDVSVGSHSSTESEPSASSPRFPRQNSTSTLTFNPSSMAVSFTSGPCRKQPQDASSWKELDQGAFSASLNLGSSENSPSSCPSDSHSTAQARPWESADAAQDTEQPAPSLRSSRNPRHLERPGCAIPGRNGQGKDLIRGCARTAQSQENRTEEPESSEAEGNQVRAPCSPCRMVARVSWVQIMLFQE